MGNILNYIIVDDDSVHNIICNLLIAAAINGSNIKTFTNPERGFEFIENNPINNEQKTIIFLDVDMPNMTGWEFLNKFDKLDEKMKSQYLIYILSSSINPINKEKASKDKNVANFFVKPLTDEIISLISGS